MSHKKYTLDCLEYYMQTREKEKRQFNSPHYCDYTIEYTTIDPGFEQLFIEILDTTYTVPVVPKSDSDYFDYLLNMREMDLARQKICGNNYIAPNYDDFILWKGAELIAERRKKNNTNTTTHPAFQVFMEWREHEEVKKNIEEERYQIIKMVYSGQNEKRMDKYERKLCRAYDFYGSFYETGSATRTKEFWNLLHCKRSRKMRKLKAYYLKQIEVYKAKAVKIRLSEKKREIQKEAREEFRRHYPYCPRCESRTRGGVYKIVECDLESNCCKRHWPQFPFMSNEDGSFSSGGGINSYYL